MVDTAPARSERTAVAEPAPRLFTVDEYYRMVETGILHNNDRVELLEGEIIQMAAMGSRHAGCINKLNKRFSHRLDGQALISIQNPLRLSSSSELQPDVMLLRPRPDDYAESHPESADVLLLIEVSDTTLRYDRDTKLSLYAKAGIPEVWIFDLEGARLLVLRNPSADGYEQVFTFRAGSAVAPAAFPELALNVEDILG
jgi:Uma2 family endonuclease